MIFRYSIDSKMIGNFCVHGGASVAHQMFGFVNNERINGIFCKFEASVEVNFTFDLAIIFSRPIGWIYNLTESRGEGSIVLDLVHVFVSTGSVEICINEAFHWINVE